MSYFDHVKCTACKAVLDPESLASRPGQGLSCPRCGAPLSMGDLFGLKDAFAEEDQEELSLDDAMSRMKAPTASVRPPEPSTRPPPARPGGGPARPAAPPSAARPAARPPGAAKAAPAGPPKQLPGPTAAPAAKTPAAPGSALEAMRALRKKK